MVSQRCVVVGVKTNQWQRVVTHEFTECVNLLAAVFWLSIHSLQGRRTTVRESYTTVDNMWHSSGAPAPRAFDFFALPLDLGRLRIHLDFVPWSLWVANKVSRQLGLKTLESVPRATSREPLPFVTTSEDASKMSLPVKFVTGATRPTSKHPVYLDIFSLYRWRVAGIEFTPERSQIDISVVNPTLSSPDGIVILVMSTSLKFSSPSFRLDDCSLHSTGRES
jgi:hypothetical protein